MKTLRRYFKRQSLVTTCLLVLVAALLVGFVSASGSPCFPDTCDPNNDGCIGPSYPCTTDADCSDDGWYCCGPKATGNPLEETFYRDYFCNASNECDYNIAASVDCDAGDAEWCEGDTRWNKGCTCRDGDIDVDCYCITTSENCDDDDGWICRFGTDIREYHNWYCSGGDCLDSITGTENCDDKDGWYPNGSNAEEYRDYRCYESPYTGADCDNYLVTDHRCNDGYGNCDLGWSNGCEVNLNTDSNNCGSCGNACGEGATCENGSCEPTAVTLTSFTVTSSETLSSSQGLGLLWQLAGVAGLGALAAGGVVWGRRRHG